MSIWKIEITAIIEADDEQEALYRAFTAGLTDMDMDMDMATVTLESES